MAVCPANRDGHTLYSHQGLTYGGLILNADCKFPDAMACFRQLLKYLNEEGIDTLQLKLLPKPYHKIPADEIDYLLFRTGAQLYRTDITSTIQLTRKLNVESSNRKRGLKKARNHGLTIREEDTFESFWDTILIPNLEVRHQAKPVHTLEEITLLKSRFPDNIRQFNVYDGDDIVAGATIFETDMVAHAQYISANDRKQELGSLDILFDTLINEVFKDKAYFDFGISNEDQGRHINSGLLSWKESFGARSVAHQFYKVKTANYVELKTVDI